jgi:hypothetical protein
MSDPNNLEGPPPTPEERAAMARELDAVAPTPGDKFALMFGHRPTPRTDEFMAATCCDLDHCTDFARQLERELADALGTISMAINSANARQAETEHARRRLAEAREEGEEQARLLGMSGEREAGLLAEIDRLKRELAEERARSFRLADRAEDLLVDLAEARGQRDRLAEALRELIHHRPRADWEGLTIAEALAWDSAEDALDALKGGAE